MPLIKIPRQLQLGIGGFPGAPEWFSRFLRVMDTWTNTVSDLFNGGIELGTHCYSQIVEIPIQAPGDGVAMSQPILTRFTQPVKGVVLIASFLTNEPLTVLAPPVTIDWKPSPESQVTLTAVQGALAGTPLTLRLLIIGG